MKHHCMKHAFAEEELCEMRTFMKTVVDGKMGARHTAPIVAVFEQRFEATFKRLAEGGKTHALCVQYYYMVDVIKIFNRTETSPRYKETFESCTAYGNHVVRYSCHDWSGRRWFEQRKDEE